MNFMRHASSWTCSSLSIATRLTIIIVRIRNFRLTLIRRNLSTVHIESVNFLRLIIHKLLLTLSGVKHSSTFHISFLSSACTATSNSLNINGCYSCVNFSILIVWIWIEIISCPRKRRQHTWLSNFGKPTFLNSLVTILFICSNLLFNVWTIATLSLGTLIYIFVTCSYSEYIFLSILFLASHISFVKKFIILSWVKSIIAYVLALNSNCRHFSIFPFYLITHSIIVSYLINCLKLVHFVQSIVVTIFVIANWITFIKIVLS